MSGVNHPAVKTKNHLNLLKLQHKNKRDEYQFRENGENKKYFCEMDLMKMFQIHKAQRHQRYYQPTTVKFMNQIDDK